MENYFKELEAEIIEIKEDNKKIEDHNDWLKDRNKQLEKSLNHVRKLQKQASADLCIIQSIIFIAGVIFVAYLLISNLVERFW